MLRISVVAASEAEVVLKVEGSILESEVGLLAQEGARWLRPGRRLVLDLAGTDHIDSAGLALLEAWSAQGLVLHGGSPYVRFLLQRRGLPHADPRP
ncbi:MAG: STAS domain-containing protein [Candidatus Latescibacterota bacterium]